MARYGNRLRYRKKRQPQRPERLTGFPTGSGGVQAPPSAPPPIPSAPSSPTQQMPQAPAPMGPGASPMDSAYWQQIGRNQQDRSGIYSRYGNPALDQSAPFEQRYGVEGQRLAQQFGFNGFENDPFSLAKQMERSYQQTREGTTNRLAAQGQLYSGHMDTMQGENQHRYQQGYHDLQRQYQQGLTGITDAATGALQALDQGDIDAFGAWLDRMIGSDPQDPGVPAPSGFYPTNNPGRPTPPVKKPVVKAVGKAYKGYKQNKNRWGR